MAAKVIPLDTRRYDGASNAPRTRNWNAPNTDATSAIDKPNVLRSRARDLVRNNPWAQKAVSVIVNNVVGYGIRAQWKTKKAQSLWNQWAESSQCDASGMQDIYGLQQLAMRAVVESGEVLIRFRPRLPIDHLSVPFQIEVLEGDYLAELLDGQKRGSNVISKGIEYDALGRRVAYYLYKTHPGNQSRAMGKDWNAYSRVDASEIIHIYRKDRPGMERGVTWLAPVMMTLRELDLYEDAYLKRQQIANMLAAFVTTEEGIEDVETEYTSLDGGLQPGAIYLMRPNRAVEFNNPPKADDYGPYTQANLRRVAAGMGITFEAQTGDLSEVNFSSARMGWQEMGRSIDQWRWSMFIPTFCRRVAAWFAEHAGVNEIPEWTPPARMMVDPIREIPAIKNAIRSGLMSQSEAIREQGYDPASLFAEMAADNAELDRLGLRLDSDPRADTSRQAFNQQPQEAEE